MKQRSLGKATGICTALVLMAGSILAAPLMTPWSHSDVALVHAAGSETQTDKDALNTAIAEAKKADQTNCTEKSIAFFQSVITLAEQVYEDPDATEDVIAKQIQLLQETSTALQKEQSAGTVYNGEYSVTGRMWHASADQPSMGNSALVQPMKVIKDGDDVKLQLEFVPLTTMGFTGYLYKLWYLPDWESETELPDADTPLVELDVTDYYDDVWDDYNNPDTGSDPNARGNVYPHNMTMPVTWGDSEIWVQVYVPVMESISTGSGQQFAKLQIDWSTVKQTAGVVTDKSTMSDRLASAKEQLKELESDPAGYSQEAIAMLRAAIAAAEEIDGNMNAGQSAVNSISRALNQAVYVFRDEKTPDISGDGKEVDKMYLHMMLLAAASVAERDGYTTDSLAVLKDAIRLAEAVYQNTEATQETVNQQVSILSSAIVGLVEKPVTNPSGSGGTGGQTTAASTNTPQPSPSATDSATSSDSQKLDINNLKDGIYSIQGSMVKIDKKTASMSNEAINHTIKLTVTNSKYFLTMNFKGLTISSQLGYLGTLKYFKTGYKLDKYGAPTGTLGDVSVDSYQLDSNGKRIKDSFGTDYPNEVTFEMISEALEDGYVPLQVFVPIMESISAGTGTQPVFLKLELDSVKSTTADDAAFHEDNTTTDAENKKTSTKKKSVLSTKSSLPSSQSSSSGNSSSTSSDDSSLISSEEEKDTEDDDSGLLATDAATDVESANMAQNSGVSNEKTQTIASDEESTTKKKNAIPMLMSLCAVAAGVLYKCKSRRIFGRRDKKK